MKTILLLILLTLSLDAFPVRFRWNPNPEPDIVEYRIYEVVPETNVLALKATIKAPFEIDANGKVRSTPIEVESGQKFVVTAHNTLLGSEPSDPVTIPNKPSKPGVVELELILESSTNLEKWDEKLRMPVDANKDAEFFRIRLVKK